MNRETAEKAKVSVGGQNMGADSPATFSDGLRLNRSIIDPRRADTRLS
jgi:hypothetical protein